MNVVIVEDMLRGFLEPQYPLFVGEEARRIIPNVQELLRRQTSAGSRIIYAGDCHAPDDPEFQMWPKHCVCGTEESQVIPELISQFPGVYLPKVTYDAFQNSNLDELLREQPVDEIAMCGVCTDICVMYTVARARMLHYPVTVYADCVASFNPEQHRFALEHMEHILGAHITTLAQDDAELERAILESGTCLD